MRKFLPVVLAILILGLGAILIGPSFIDWNKYKPQIIDQAKSAAGYDVKIDGKISMSVLPMPHVSIEGLSVAAPRGRAENLLTMKRADVSVSLMPLLSGNIVVDTVRLVNPDIQLETLPNGENSWMSDKMLESKDDAGASADASGSGNAGAAEKIVLNKLEIVDGRLSYVDRRSGKEQKVEEINTSLKADTLKGPFAAEGSLKYNGKTIAFDGDTKKIDPKSGDIDADVMVSLPDNNAEFSFNGVVGQNPLNVQGKIEAKADNLASALAFGGETPNPALAQKLSFSGLVTAGEDKVQSEDIDITFGKTQGKGSVVMTGLKAKNPVVLNADMGFSGILNFDDLAPAAGKSAPASVEERVAKGEKLSGRPGFLPETLSLPFPLNAKIRIVADGIQSNGAVFKGITADITKDGPSIDILAKAMDIPGKTKVEGSAALRYGTSSVSGEHAVTYADPAVTFSVRGSSEQLPTLLRTFAPDQGSNPALEIYKTAQFSLGGDVTRDMVSVKNSNLKLDQTTVGLTASYKPYGAAGRPDIFVDLSTDTVDLDYIMGRLNGQKNQVVQKSSAAKTDVKKALEPVRSFEVPVNLTFDLSAQKAIYNQQQITGVRIKGRAAGPSLTLDVASAQNFMGAAASLKGAVSNLKDLSGIDLSFYGKTSDIKSLMHALKMDASKIPASVNAAEVNVAAKGEADNLDFSADVAALNGELKASGQMTGLLDTPSFNNLTIGAKHPNLVRAVQIVNPGFSGGPGLEKPFEFNAKAVKNGNSYDLTGMNASLGATTLAGDLKIATGGAVPSVSGKIDAGNIPLDSLLGAKTSAASGGGSGGAAASSDGGKWSRTTIDTGWMHTINLDLALSAKSITYGGWNFTNPNTKITLKDGNLLVDNLQSGLFGGTAKLDAKVQDPADPKLPLSVAVQSAMDKVDLEPLVTAMSGTNRLKATGDVSLDMNVQTTGLSSHALMSGLGGKANLSGNNVVMKGFDLAQIGLAFVDTGKPLDRLNGIVGGATQSGETRFDTIKGAYDINQGIATITSMEMDGASANIVSKGNVNLPLWTIDTVHTITFKQAKEAGAFDVAIKGSLSSPANTFGRGIFNDVLTRRLRQQAVDKLPDVLGKDLSGKLQNLGILPQKQAAPTAAPATDVPATTTPDAAAPETTTPEQTPEAAPATTTTPQTQKQQLQDEGQKALQGVLKGLLQ